MAEKKKSKNLGGRPDEGRSDRVVCYLPTDLKKRAFKRAKKENVSLSVYIYNLLKKALG